MYLVRVHMEATAPLRARGWKEKQQVCCGSFGKQIKKGSLELRAKSLVLCPVAVRLLYIPLCLFCFLSALYTVRATDNWMTN